MAKKDKMLLLGIVLVAIAIIAVFAFIYIYVTTPPAQQQQIVTPPQPTQYKLTLPTVFTVNDIWAGRTMTGVTIEIYKYTTKELLESGTVTNTYTTINPLTSDDRYWVKLSKTVSSKTYFKYYDITIPRESSPSASNHYITLDFYSLDSDATYPIKAYKPDGTALSSGEDYDVGTNYYPSFTIMIGPPSDDSGLMNTYDPIKTIDRQILVVINVQDINSTYGDSNKLIVSNIPVLYSVTSTNRNFGFTVDPSKLTRDIASDGRVLSEGIYTFTLSFDASGFASTDGARITITLYAFSNESYFKTYGTHPTGYIEIGSFTFDIVQ